MSLNYKGLLVKTIWVEYPDIESLYHKLNLEATSKSPDGGPLYTLPVIYDPSTGSTVSDSAAIAKYLDKTYPNTPVLFHKGTDAFQTAFLDAWHEIL